MRYDRITPATLRGIERVIRKALDAAKLEGAACVRPPAGGTAWPGWWQDAGERDVVLGCAARLSMGALTMAIDRQLGFGLPARERSVTTMPEARRTVVINRPVGEVFAFFTDPRNDQKWRPQVKEISAERPASVGTLVHQVIKGPGGRGIAADIEVTGYEPATRYAFRAIAGPVRPTGEYRFAAQRDDATSVTFSLDAHLSGMKKLLMSRAVQASMNAEMAALDTAKAILEKS